MRVIGIIALVILAATGLDAARPSGQGAAKRRHVLELETSAATQVPAHKVATRGFRDCLDGAAQNAEEAITENMCMHGRFCGRECSGVVDGQPDKPKAPPMDELDRACFFHDKCLTKENRGTCAGCHCNAQLDAVANKIWKEGSAAERCGCNLFDKTCSDDTKDAYYVHLYATLYETSTNCGRPEDCPDAPVGDQCRASLMYETDLNGGTLQDVSVNDWAECCDVCSSDPDCRAWTYSIGICSLKDSSGWTAEAREGYMSGLSLSTPL